MPFYLAWIYSSFSLWNFKFISIYDLSYGTNQDFMPFIKAQFFVARYPKKYTVSGIWPYMSRNHIKVPCFICLVFEIYNKDSKSLQFFSTPLYESYKSFKRHSKKCYSRAGPPLIITHFQKKERLLQYLQCSFTSQFGFVLGQ